MRSGLIADFSVIVETNLRVLALLLLGSGTFGVISILVLAWNSLFLGFHLHSLWIENSAALLYSIFYIPVEFLSLCFMAAGAESLGVWLFQQLLSSEQRRFMHGHSVFCYWVIAAVLALAAALLEVLAKAIRVYTVG